MFYQVEACVAINSSLIEVRSYCRNQPPDEVALPDWKHFTLPRKCAAGGSAKLAVALAIALPPTFVVGAAALVVLAALLFEWTRRWHGRHEVPGSIPISAAIALTVTTAAVFGG